MKREKDRQRRMTIAEARVRGMLARRAAAPLKGKADQNLVMDIGLWSDAAKQIDFIDVLRRQNDAIDFEAS